MVLTCNATFNSPLDSIQLTWGRPHTITTNDDGRTTIAETNTGVVYTSHLTVSDIGERDEGEYVCTLTGIDRNGEHVTVHHSITVAVSGKYLLILVRVDLTGVQISFSLQDQAAVVQLHIAVDLVGFS